jgi:hypothetical protein
MFKVERSDWSLAIEQQSLGKRKKSLVIEKEG